MTARPTMGAAVLSIGAGAALGCAFPPFGLWWLAPVGVALLSLAVRGRRKRTASWLGALAGFVCFAILVRWLRVVGSDGWLVVAALEALYFAPLGVGLLLAQRSRLWPLLSALVWVADEAIRVRTPFGGFPWGRLAFSQAQTPFTPLAAIGGAQLVSFAVALCGVSALAAFLHLAERGDRPARRTAAAWGGIALATALVGLVAVVPVAGDQRGGQARATVALVQGNVPRLGLDFLGQRRAVLNNHVAATAELRRKVDTGQLPMPDAVLWPENASDLDPFTDPDAAALISAAVRGMGVPTLIGAVLNDRTDPEHYVENSGIVWDPKTGPGERYVKRHPVPFGEYLPFRSTITKLVGRFALVPRDFRHGDKVGVLDLGPVRIGDVICFEIAYDHIVRDAVTHGGRVIVVQTNNATYGRTGETQQQLAMSQLRAVEHARAVLVVSTSGISAVIRPDGKVLQQSQEFTQELLVSAVPLRGTLTVADRLGAWPEGVGAVLGLSWLLVLARRRPLPAAGTP